MAIKSNYGCKTELLQWAEWLQIMSDTGPVDELRPKPHPHIDLSESEHTRADRSANL